MSSDQNKIFESLRADLASNHFYADYLVEYKKRGGEKIITGLSVISAPITMDDKVKRLKEIVDGDSYVINPMKNIMEIHIVKSK